MGFWGANIQDIRDDLARYPDKLGSGAATGGTTELLNFTGSNLYINTVQLSCSNSDGAEVEANVSFDADTGSDIILLKLHVPANGHAKEVIQFFPPIHVTRGGDIDVTIGGTSTEALASVTGSQD